MMVQKFDEDIQLALDRGVYTQKQAERTQIDRTLLNFERKKKINNLADQIHDVVDGDKELFNETAAERCERIDDEPDQCYYCGTFRHSEQHGKMIVVEESDPETGPMPSDMTDVWVCGLCKDCKK